MVELYLSSGCKVFTWTDFNGGTCWMKGDNWSFQDGMQGATCGYVQGRVADNDGSKLIGQSFNHLVFNWLIFFS